MNKLKKPKLKIAKMFPTHNGIGIGWDEERNYAVNLYFKKEHSLDIPHEVDGVKIKPAVIGKIVAF